MNCNTPQRKPSGAPRVFSLPPEEMIALGEEMIKWILENNPIHLTQWWAIHKNFTDRQWDAMRHIEEFVPYYQKALKIIGLQYLQKNSEIEPSLKHRWQRVYFKDLKRCEDADAEAEAKRKAEALKGDARAAEEERQHIIETIQRNNQPIKV